MKTYTVVITDENIDHQELLTALSNLKPNAEIMVKEGKLEFEDALSGYIAKIANNELRLEMTVEELDTIASKMIDSAELFIAVETYIDDYLFIYEHEERDVRNASWQ